MELKNFFFFSGAQNKLGVSQKVDHKSLLFPTCFERLAIFKDQSLSIDAVIKSGPLRVGGHSIILAAAIPFFQGLFLSSNPPPPPNQEIELEIDGVDPIVVISIIEWAYTGNRCKRKAPEKIYNAKNKVKLYWQTKPYKVC